MLASRENTKFKLKLDQCDLIVSKQFLSPSLNTSLYNKLNKEGTATYPLRRFVCQGPYTLLKGQSNMRVVVPRTVLPVYAMCIFRDMRAVTGALEKNTYNAPAPSIKDYQCKWSNKIVPNYRYTHSIGTTDLRTPHLMLEPYLDALKIVAGKDLFSSRDTCLTLERFIGNQFFCPFIFQPSNLNSSHISANQPLVYDQMEFTFNFAEPTTNDLQMHIIFLYDSYLQYSSNFEYITGFTPGSC